MNDILGEIYEVLEARKSAAPESSYVALLYAGGDDAILRKISEEATELMLAAKSADQNGIVHEVADLWFHSLVLLSHCGIPLARIHEEMERRFGVSGLEEKASRTKK